MEMCGAACEAVCGSPREAMCGAGPLVLATVIVQGRGCFAARSQADASARTGEKSRSRNIYSCTLGEK